MTTLLLRERQQAAHCFPRLVDSFVGLLHHEQGERTAELAKRPLDAFDAGVILLEINHAGDLHLTNVELLRVRRRLSFSPRDQRSQPPLPSVTQLFQPAPRKPLRSL